MSIEHSSVIASPVDEVFAWHERPGAFTRLTPPWQAVTLVSESESLVDGTAVLALPGGLTWVSQHDPSGYDLPLGSRILRPMFRYRHRQLSEDLEVHRWAATQKKGPLTIAVTGSTGLVGTALCAFLTTGGHTVIRLVRRPATGSYEREWDPANPHPALLDGVDALVHLAGESIAGRFTETHKRAIRESRIEPTRLLAELAAKTHSGPTAFVCASAIGIYGADRGDEHVTESSTFGDDYLAGVVAEWEGATAPASEAGIRVSMIRTGIVQSARGGSLKIYRPLFSAGLGGPIAGGAQWVSWIDIDDLLDVYYRALLDDRVFGPVNAVAPNPVRNADYAKILARVLRRPAILPVPALGPRVLLGSEGSKSLVEGGQFVVPAVLAEAGHHFRRTDLENSLRHQLGRFLPPEHDSQAHFSHFHPTTS